MSNFLNLTLPIKQDKESQDGVEAFIASFGAEGQPKVNAIMKASRDVHNARAVPIRENVKTGKILFLQVITEYDSSFKDYTVFFSRYLPTFFAALFQHVPDGLTLEQIRDPDRLVEFIGKYDIEPLGRPDLHFNAYPLTVKEIQDKFGITVPPLPPLPH